MEYGASLFANAPKTSLILLERVQNHSLRLALGATKTTPISALKCEAINQEVQTHVPICIM